MMKSMKSDALSIKRNANQSSSLPRDVLVACPNQTSINFSARTIAGWWSDGGRGHRESQSRQKRHKVCGCNRPFPLLVDVTYTHLRFSPCFPPFFRLFPLTQRVCGGYTKNTRLFFHVCGSRIAKFRHRAPQCTQYRRLISFPPLFRTNFIPLYRSKQSYLIILRQFELFIVRRLSLNRVDSLVEGMCKKSKRERILIE